MKLVSLISSYSPKNDSVDRVISELKKVSDKIVVFTASDHVYDGCEVISFEKSVGINLVFKPREWIVQHIDDDWDYVLYNEDDILISSESIKEAIHLQESIASPHVVGFNRFERHNGEKYWIDQHPDHGIHTGHSGKQYITKDELFWIPANFHSGNFLLSKKSITKLISENKFDTHFNQHGVSYCGVLESGATSLYRHLPKVLPIRFETVECEHLDNKYCFIQPTPTTQQLKEILA